MITREQSKELVRVAANLTEAAVSQALASYGGKTEQDEAESEYDTVRREFTEFVASLEEPEPEFGEVSNTVTDDCGADFKHSE